MKKLLLAIILLPLFSNAQSNYKPGFIVNLKGDTIRGVIDYKEWDLNPNNIQFNDNRTPGKSETVSTDNATAFGINGFEYYQRFTLKVSQDQVDINKLPVKIDTAFLTNTVFLKTNSSGKHLTLYSYTDNIKSRYYILNAGETLPQELVYHAFYNSDESSSIQYINRFRIQLAYLAQKYNISTPGLQNRISEANYKEEDLVKIVQLINDNTSTGFSANNLWGTRWFVGIGANSSQIKFKSTDVTSSTSKQTYNSSSIFPKITAGLDFFQNKNVQRLQFRAELSVTMNHYNITIANSGATPSTSNLNFKQINTALTPQIIYNLYNGPNLKFFLDAGTTFNFSAYNNYAFITSYSSSFPDNVMNKYPALSSFWISFPIRAGVAINKTIEINACYIPSSSLTKDAAQSINVTSYQVGINYLFK